jgi:chromosome segregation ATPase
MSRQTPRTSSKGKTSSPLAQTLPELRNEVRRLEAELEDRKLLFVDLCEASGTSTAVTPAAGASSGSPSLPLVGPVAVNDVAAEASRLTSRNAFLTEEIKMLEAIERKFANDPRVLDKRNEVKLVRMQIAQVEREVATLQTVKKRRDVGLRAIGKSEEQARRVRGQQHKINAELREEVKQLMEELRGLEKTDIDMHERCARLQDQVKLSVTDADVRALRDEVAQYDVDIEKLAETEATWRQRQASAREEEHRSIAKMRRECAALEEEEARLQKLLQQNDLKLKRSYQPAIHLL